MKDVHQRLAEKGLVVVAVNLDKDRALADGFIREFRPQFPIVYDKEGKLAQQYKITAMPYSLIIDRDGNTRHLHSGFAPEQRQKLDDELRQLLN
jgi:peroxiredoxin